MLTRAKPGGFGFHDKLLSSQLEHIDSQLPNALDVIGGGAYAPTADITIDASVNGHGLILDGVHHIGAAGNLTFDAGSLVTSAATWRGVYAFGDGAGHNATVTIATGSTFTINSGFTTNSGTCTFNGSTVNVSGGAGLSVLGGSFTTDDLSTVSLGGNIGITGPITRSGTASMNSRRIDGSDSASPHTYSVNDADVIDWTTSATADRIHVWTDTGAVNGSEITFTNYGSHEITVQRPLGTNLCFMGPATGHSKSLTLIFDGTNWRTKINQLS